MNNKIPKTIHYCWFGKGEKNQDIINYINSWKKNCPDYEIIEWNEDNFDINCNAYVREAYKQKKYAFVTDYVRLFALYNYGGIYMDTDVEVLKPLDSFLANSSFAGFENNEQLCTAVIGAEKNNPWIKDLMEEYNDRSFIMKDGSLDLTTNVIRVTNLTREKYGLKTESSFQNLNDIVCLYPIDYFSPKDWFTGKINITENTYTIHHFVASWHSEKQKKQNEKIRQDLLKYIKKYGEKKGKEKFNKNQAIKYDLTHPLDVLKRKLMNRRDK